MADRTVHASHDINGWELVRYNRAGKWFFERDNEPRQHVTLIEAVNRVTCMSDWTIYEKRPGGQAFDAKVRQARLRNSGTKERSNGN